MRWYDPLLYPLSFCYHLVTKQRNRMFDKGRLKSSSFGIPTVVVGNLSVGGSGKTPMVEFLVNYFSQKYKLTVLSRGYGRKTKGFFWADSSLGPGEIGDEPFQIYSKFRDKISVAVGEDRVAAIRKIQDSKPDTDLIILDDAYQHRYLKADFYLLLTTYQNPFFSDSVMPLGKLREAPEGASRADLIIVTKCPAEMDESMMKTYKKSIAKYSQAKTIFSHIQYAHPFPVFDKTQREKQNAIVVSGIANDRLFIEACHKRYKVINILSFADHHHYRISDVQKMVAMVKSNPETMLITTEKDAVKLKNPRFHEYLAEIPIFALPIKVKMSAKDEDYLILQISKAIAEKVQIL
jgi:tetraacyldisaccharide 4'-kinase